MLPIKCGNYSPDACKKHLQLLEKISQRHLTVVSKRLLLHFIICATALQMQSSLKPPKTSGWESDYSYLKIFKGFILEHSPCCHRINRDTKSNHTTKVHTSNLHLLTDSLLTLTPDTLASTQTETQPSQCK